MAVGVDWVVVVRVVVHPDGARRHLRCKVCPPPSIGPPAFGGAVTTHLGRQCVILGHQEVDFPPQIGRVQPLGLAELALQARDLIVKLVEPRRHLFLGPLLRRGSRFDASEEVGKETGTLGRRQ
jgi:hypothetical protein